jgi:FKBP-type peptidyl-prolyl cis-trans isomerase FklB
MYRFCFVLLMSAMAAWVVAQEQEEVPAKAPAGELKTTRDQASYAIGLNIGRNLKRDGLELSSEQLVQGLRDALTNSKAKLTDEQCRVALEAFDRQLQQVITEKNKVLGEKNKKEGAAFLAANKKKQGVTTLPGGVQYTVLKAGKGPSPTANDVVRVHYHGTLIDGTVFDSTIESKQPAVIPVGGVIRGWIDALEKMKVGDKWRLVIPSESAYGAQGAPPVIGPHAVLIFDLELLAIEPKQ